MRTGSWEIPITTTTTTTTTTCYLDTLEALREGEKWRNRSHNNINDYYNSNNLTTNNLTF